MQYIVTSEHIADSVIKKLRQIEKDIDEPIIREGREQATKDDIIQMLDVKTSVDFEDTVADRIVSELIEMLKK